MQIGYNWQRGNQVFGIEGGEFQSLYHFTVGMPVEDTRLMTLPAYD